MATSTGTMICRGLKSKQAYIVDVHFVDAVADYDHFATGGVKASAGSPEEWQAPPNEGVMIEKIIQTSATTATHRHIVINGTGTASVLLCATFIPSATNIAHPFLGVVVPAGGILKFATS